MNRQFIPDREIVLSKDTDLLNTSIYANNLVNLIKSAPQGQVFNIGLFGSWGSGKSSIIATTKEQLKSSKDSKVKFVTYDAWKYANDSFRRMFLFEVQKELGFKRTSLMEKFYQNSNQEVDINSKISPLKVWLMVAGSIFVLLLVSILNIDIEYKISIYSLMALLSVLIGILTGCFNQLKVSVSKPFMFAPEQFEQCFQEMMEEALKPNIIQRAFKFITRNPDYISHKQIVIVIDNIDRCNREQSYNLLTDIKTFLCDEHFNIVFVIPVDDEALRKHILNTSHNNNMDECARDKEEFLRKFFNVTLRIKPHQPTEMFEFAQKLNTKYALGFNSATINIASKEYAKNPRRVIQLFNNLSVELENYDVEFASKYETLICKILIIREEYNIFYKELLNDYTLFDKLELPKALNEKEKTELKRLLVDTKSYTSDYNSTVLSRILSNSESQFADVPLKIREVVDSNNYDEAEKLLLGWIENKSNMNAFVGYCLLNIDKAIRRKLFDSEFKACIEFIAQVNNKYEFTRDLNLRISERLQDNFKDIIPKINEPQHMVRYAIYLQTQGLDYLISNIVKYIEGYKDHTNNIWDLYFKSCIELCDIGVLNQLSDIFVEEYKKGKYEITELTQEQINSLATDELLQYIIDELSVNDGETKFVDELVCISQNSNISEANSLKVYNKIYTNLGDLRGVKKDDLLSKIKIINRITEHLSCSKLQPSISEVYKLIVGKRNIPNPSYPYNHNYDSKVELFQECETLEELDIIAKFITTTYKVSNEQVFIEVELEKLRAKNEEITIKNILLLKEAGCHLYPLASHLIRYSLYENRELMSVYHAYFTDEYNGGPILREDELNWKLEKMLQYAIDNKNEEVFGWLYDRSRENNRIRMSLVPIISSKSKEEIQTLPKGLMDLAINSVDEYNIESYWRFIDLLKCLATNGSKLQKQYLVKLLIKKLDEREDIQNIALIIKSFTQLTKAYADRLITTLKCIKEETTDETTIMLCNESIEHLSSI